jgi:hypothetical protein
LANKKPRRPFGPGALSFYAIRSIALRGFGARNCAPRLENHQQATLSVRRTTIIVFIEGEIKRAERSIASLTASFDSDPSADFDICDRARFLSVLLIPDHGVAFDDEAFASRDRNKGPIRAVS